MTRNTISKIIIAVAMIVLCVSEAHAIIAVSWGTSEGFFRSDGTNALLGASGKALAQLIFTPSGTIGDVDVFAPGYVSGDNVLFQSLVLDRGFADEYGSFSYIYTGAYVAGYIFMRVFDRGSESGIVNGMWYFDTPLTQTVNNTSDPMQPNAVDFGPMTPTFGDTLNKQVVVIPEPATWAMMLLGATALVGRKLRRK